MPDHPRLSHLFLHVRDVSAARAFYVDLLGVPVLHEDEPLQLRWRGACWHSRQK